jgi:N-acetylmuramoyl-L-alanine amidase
MEGTAVIRQEVSRRTLLGAGTAGAVVIAGSGTLFSGAEAVATLTADQIGRTQSRLNTHGFWCGPVTNVVNELTTCAVLAFQKAHGLKVDGILDYDFAVGLTKTWPAAPRFSSNGTVVEVDLKRQLVRVVSNGTIQLTLHASTGNGAVGSFGDRAVLNRTPAGLFHIRRVEADVVTNSLGTQYRPHYFRGRYGIYGLSAIAGIRHSSTTGGVAVHRDALDLLHKRGSLVLQRRVQIA